MYKITLTNQAEIIFPSFERAIRHLKGQIFVSVPDRYVSEIVECGNIFHTDYGTNEATMEKISK